MTRVGALFAAFASIIFLTAGCGDPQAEAQQALEQQLALRSENRARSAELYKKANRAVEDQRFKEARSLLREAVRMDDRNAEAWMTLGVVEYRMDRLFDAAMAFDRAARLRPNRYEPHFNMGTVLELAGRYDEAIDAYETALKLAPEDVQAMENLARCYVRADRDRGRAAELAGEALRSEQRPEWRAWLERLATRPADRKGDTK